MKNSVSMRFIDSSMKNIDSTGEQGAHSESTEYRTNQFKIYQVTRSSFYENNPLSLEHAKYVTNHSSRFQNDGSKEILVQGTNELKVSNQKQSSYQLNTHQPSSQHHDNNNLTFLPENEPQSWQQQSEQLQRLHMQWKQQQSILAVKNKPPDSNTVDLSLQQLNVTDAAIKSNVDKKSSTKVDVNNRW